ncbi:MAG: hypothetical protein KDD36_06455 [Flavobacteriales bacterium]|nr:hypothetical protein [Flavobacteriales bacterium]
MTLSTSGQSRYPQTAIKTGILAPALGHVNLEWEQHVGAGVNIVTRGGYIGVGEEYRDNSGGYFGLGLKVLTSHVDSMRFQCTYLKPEVVFSSFSHPEYYGVKKEASSQSALLLSVGKQNRVLNHMVVDYHVGFGFGIGDSDFAFTHARIYTRFPYVITGGILLGFIF